jgi:WD40 repeat protein
MKLSRRAHMRVSQVTGASPQGVLVHDHGELCVSVQLHGGGAGTARGRVSGGVALSDFHTRLDSSEVLYVQSAIGCMQCTPSYIVLGLGSGQVSVLSVRSSKVILSFTAHESPVRPPARGVGTAPLGLLWIHMCGQCLHCDLHGLRSFHLACALRHLGGMQVTCVQLRRDDELKQEVLVTGAADGSLRSFDFTTGKPLQTFLGHRAAVTCLQFDSAKVTTPPKGKLDAGSSSSSPVQGLFQQLPL